MSALADLKASASRRDVAILLGYKPSALTYILYKLPVPKYSDFEIPKKSGGVRIISAPEARLKALQRQLANFLYDCRDEIEETKPRKPLSHGFRKRLSIVTNAKEHRKKRYVLNFDLQDFFPSINFGRVRGFLIKNNDFGLAPEVATTIAQIACHKNALPQGSPCSPIISDFVAHILDIRLVQLAKKHKCTYTRYADDITFSTNQRTFPADVAYKPSDKNPTWLLGKELLDIVRSCDFKINPDKTRMQYSTSRQSVTGLIVNQIPNVRCEYYRHARAMTDHLFREGAYVLEKGKAATTQTAKLEGVLNHIFHIRDAMDLRLEKEKQDNPASVTKLFRDFLFFKNFVALTQPMVICEGVTDAIYLRSAIPRLPAFHPQLFQRAGGRAIFKISLFKHSARKDRILQMSTGSGGLKNFISKYDQLIKRYKHLPLKHPVIILIDNDSGASKIFSLLKTQYKITLSLTSRNHYYHICHNLYLVKTEEVGVGGTSSIEDAFDKIVLDTKLHGKTFNRKNEIDSSKEYGKVAFAERVVRPGKDRINFSGFSRILERISAVISDYKPPI